MKTWCDSLHPRSCRGSEQNGGGINRWVTQVYLENGHVCVTVCAKCVASTIMLDTLHEHHHTVNVSLWTTVIHSQPVVNILIYSYTKTCSSPWLTADNNFQYQQWREYESHNSSTAWLHTASICLTQSSTCLFLQVRCLTNQTNCAKA